MKSSICVTNIRAANRKQPASFRMVGLMLTIAPLWLMLAAANTSAYAQTNPSPADWTQFLRANMQRWNPYETVLGVGNVGNLQVKWKNPIGTWLNPFLSSPAVVNGVVYVGSSADRNVYALNASSGTKLWSFTTGDLVLSSPSVVNGVVYVGSGDDNVYALNASTGAKLWNYTTGGSVFSSPSVVNGMVYVGSYDNNVYALNAGTGAKLWSFTTGGLVKSSPAVANGVVYVGSFDGNLYALNASTGAKLWSYPTGSYVASSPAVANGVAYVGSGDSNLYALNASTGAKLWSYPTGSYVLSNSPAVANGVVFVTGFVSGIMYALNASTGAKLWSYNIGGQSFSAPAVANGVVYIGGGDANLYALNASNGAKLWSYSTETASSSPTIVDGVVYIYAGDRSGNTNVYAFAPATADLFLRINLSTAMVHQGDLLTYAFPVWNLGPDNATHEVLNTEVPAGTTFDYIRISGTPGLGTCTHPPYQGTGQIVCHQNGAMAPNTTWTVRLTVRVTAPAGTVITENAATMGDTVDPNLANNTATVGTTVQ
jgi:outer membrane protein assembly factor BamB